MKVIIPGGSGQIGHLLCRDFLKRDWEVVVLGRGSGGRAPRGARFVSWDAKQAGDWCGELESSDAVINLVGRSVDCRYPAANRSGIP